MTTYSNLAHADSWTFNEHNIQSTGAILSGQLYNLMPDDHVPGLAKAKWLKTYTPIGNMQEVNTAK